MPLSSRPDEYRAYAPRVAAAFGLPAWTCVTRTENSPLVSSRWDSSDIRFFLVFGDENTMLQVENAQSKVVVRWNSNAPQELFKFRWLSDNAAQEVALPLLRAVFCLGYPIESLCTQAGVSVSGHDKIEWALAMKEAGYPMSTAPQSDG